MLIVEGVDGIGKTTLCHRLVRELQDYGPWVYRWFTKLPGCWRYPTDYVPHVARFVVQDRFHMSEIVYRAARQEEQLMSPLAYRWLDGYLRGVGAFTVVLTTTDERARSVPAGGQMHDAETHVRVNRLYRSIANGRDERYRPDFDYVYCPFGKGWPAEDNALVQLVVDLYVSRQRWLDGTVQAQARSVRPVRP